MGQLQIEGKDYPKLGSSTPLPSAIPTLIKTGSVNENIVEYTTLRKEGKTVKYSMRV